MFQITGIYVILTLKYITVTKQLVAGLITSGLYKLLAQSSVDRQRMQKGFQPIFVSSKDLS